jgi:hypothetical protein
MKRQLLTAIMLSFVVALAVTTVTAQSGSHLMRITIPFEFTIRDKALPSGEYIVRRSVSERPETLTISRVDGSSGEYVLTSAVQTNSPRAESMLVFHSYGERYFLTQVWSAGDSAGRELPKTTRERELAKNAVTRQTVTLAARH